MALATFTVAALSSTTTPALTTAYASRPTYADGVTVESSASQGFGRSLTQTFFASVTRAGGAFTGITFKVQVSFDGANPLTAAAVNWTDIQIVNLADSTKAIEQSISPGANATACATYGTQDASNAPFVRVLVKSTGGNAGAGDSATINAVAS